MHFIENLFTLTLYLHANLTAKLRKLGDNVAEGLFRPLRISYHHHVEIILDNRLGYIKDVHPVVGKIGARLGENANRIFADSSASIVRGSR
jgi:hypothetical protein